MEDNPLYLKTKQSINVDKLATLKDMSIRDPSKSRSTAVDENYKAKENKTKKTKQIREHESKSSNRSKNTNPNYFNA